MPARIVKADEARAAQVAEAATDALDPAPWLYLLRRMCRVASATRSPWRACKPRIRPRPGPRR